MRNKRLMIPVICLLSFVWLALECALLLLSLMARGAFRQIHSFMRTR